MNPSLMNRDSADRTPERLRLAVAAVQVTGNLYSKVNMDVSDEHIGDRREYTY